MSLGIPASTAGGTAAAAALPAAVWRASQMACSQAAVVASGHAALDRELPDGGWPVSSLIELLAQQPGIGEMRLLRPALTAIAQQRRIVLVQPPHAPQTAAWSGWGLPAERLLWIRTERTADALWSAEQILRNGSCGALLFWQRQIRPEALRRLHLAAQAADTLFWLLRPLAGAQDASPAPLRLALRPARTGIAVDIVKRRGPQCAKSLLIQLGLPLQAAAEAKAGVSTGGAPGNGEKGQESAGRKTVRRVPVAGTDAAADEAAMLSGFGPG